jgi:glycosyltransferase involved in cell wall biosynthesis
LRILFLNRRDIKNPNGGGAEVYTHEIARGLVEKHKYEIVVFASRFNGSTSEELVDGVKHVRKGNEVTVHLWGFLYALKQRKNFDLLIDEFNGSGFFTFFFSNTILLIHQMYKEFWFREFGFIGAIPNIVESLLLRLYKKKLTITVSNSTKADLQNLGFKNVNIVMNAISPHSVNSSLKKAKVPTLVFLGRMKSTKRPEDAIEIYKKTRTEIPSLKLWMIGRGPDENRLKKRATGLKDVTFWGLIDNEKKMQLLKVAHVLLVPGVREGFGINVLEAASVGTPAVGYNVHGLRDSIVDGENGFLVSNSSDAAERVIQLLNEKDLYNRISQNCLNYVKDFTWDKRVEEFWQYMQRSKKNGK